MSLFVAEYRFPVKRMIKTLALFILVLCVLSGCKGGRNVPLFDAWQKLDDTEFKEGNAAFEKAAAEFKDEIETEINSFEYFTYYYEKNMGSFSEFKNWKDSLEGLSQAFSLFEKSGRTEGDYMQLRLSLGENMACLMRNYSGILLWSNVIYMRLLVAFAVVTVLCALIAVFYRYSVKRTKRESEDAVAIIHAQEAERQRISREIHDTVLQDLNAQHLLLSKVCDNLETSRSPVQAGTIPAEFSDSLFQMQALTKNVSQRLRSICRNLVPPELEEGFLYDAVSLLCRNFAAVQNIKCTFSCGNDARDILNSLSDQSKLNVFRLIQESLSNAARHSQAQETSVIIRLSSESESAEKHIVVFVTDDGCGFDVKKALASGFAGDGVSDEAGERIRLGIRGMYSRAAQLNGTLRITSSAGEGTSVRLEFPV